MVAPAYTGKMVEVLVSVSGMSVSDENTRPKVKLSKELYKQSRELAKDDGRSWSAYVERLIAQDVDKKKSKRGK